MPTFILDEVIASKKKLEAELLIAKNEKRFEQAKQLKYRLMDIKEFLLGCF